LLALPPPQWNGEKNQKQKAKLVAWDKDHLKEQQRKRRITTITLIKSIYKTRDTLRSFAHCPTLSLLLSSDPPSLTSSPS